MKISTLGRRIHTATKLLQNRELRQARRKGISLAAYEKWNQPWIRQEGFKTVLDIGANVGQFAACIHLILPDAKILSFEPLPDCFDALKRNMSDVPGFEAYNVGLGMEAGTATFERNAFAPSSSFLKMTDAHKHAFPFTAHSERVSVRVERLDDVACNLSLTHPLLVKIDVQGFEDRVLAGGKNTISKAQLVVIETSFSCLYEGQPAFEQIHRNMNDLGFEYGGVMDQLLDPVTGRILQADSIFSRK